MNEKKSNTKRAVVIIFAIIFTTSVNAGGLFSSSLSSAASPLNNDFELYINGGLGCTVGVINNGSQELTAYYNITFGMTGSNIVDGRFEVPPNLGEEMTFIPFTLLTLIVASISVEGETLTKTGLVITVFVLFPK